MLYVVNTASLRLSIDDNHTQYRYTPAEYRLIAQLPIVEVWDAEAQAQDKAHAESRVFISVQGAVQRKEVSW